MPALSPKIFVRKLLDAFAESGGSGYYVSEAYRTHPRKFFIEYGDETISVWVYIWTITHGGRVSLPDEYRIQMTSVKSPLQLNPEGYTLLAGYYQELNIFSGFDLKHHRVFTSGSPSVQIQKKTLLDGLQNGMAFDRKNNEEIAIAIRPDQLINYIFNAESLHEHGTSSRLYKLLGKAANMETISESAQKGLTKEKKKILQLVEKYARDANFSKSVKLAYDNRCAVTRQQLKLLDAAHILPFSESMSPDTVNNGLSLSPTYHRAYDNGLIYLDENYHMRIRNSKLDELRAAGQVGGLKKFIEPLGKIHLPSDRNQWPDKELIIQANKFRHTG
ncbi:HNH endonuclease signature motif containing protein [Kiritimatiellaeota bacterium B1221]|nr:HNH endonuclease signature motif containing protein [Kiritimatiellaeota bacterium B1221]